MHPNLNNTTILPAIVWNLNKDGIKTTTAELQETTHQWEYWTTCCAVLKVIHKASLITFTCGIFVHSSMEYMKEYFHQLYV